MGLDIKPFGASWSYSGFAYFREGLAAEEGITLSAMQGFGGTGEWETTSGQHVTPLAPLLNHSDCDGHLESHECEEVAPRLRLILDRWADSDGVGRWYDVTQGRLLLQAIEHSIEHGCAVVFR